ncbi:hypothetical protein [Acidovorax sp. M2(2025)]|uniref:hypothetical protein n=1 Tax=Acidovorax sp. M2(2025) TaxID=3411355 RepID=UPI003BF5504D
MIKQIHKPSLVLGAVLALATSLGHAEQTIGIQNAGATPAIATARVNVRVTVPKTVILRVGAADATISDVVFTYGVTPAVAGAPGNSLPYTGAIAPTLATTVATTNPTTTAGVLTTGAWTNVSGGARLTCALSGTGGATTAFATGATVGGVPGTADILVAGTTPAHPGTSLASCDGTISSTIAALTALSGTFTYSTAFTASAIAAGSYGTTVTYTATTL